MKKRPACRAAAKTVGSASPRNPSSGTCPPRGRAREGSPPARHRSSRRGDARRRERDRSGGRKLGGRRRCRKRDRGGAERSVVPMREREAAHRASLPLAADPDPVSVGSQDVFAAHRESVSGRRGGIEGAKVGDSLATREMPARRHRVVRAQRDRLLVVLGGRRAVALRLEMGSMLTDAGVSVSPAPPPSGRAAWRGRQQRRRSASTARSPREPRR